MEAETSPFETSEMLATFLASTPLLSDSWTLCRFADQNLQHSFWVDQKGDVSYVAVSALQGSALNPWDPSFWNLVALDGACGGVFAPLCRRDEDEEPAKVSAGVLSLFSSMLPNLQAHMRDIMQRSQLIVITGHTIGGLIASLSTLWLLSYLRTVTTARKVFCVTFGSPLLGNKSLSRAILREMWGVNFCHVSSKHDIMPRLLFVPLSPHFTPLLYRLFHFWTLLITSQNFNDFYATLTHEERSAIFISVLEFTKDEAIGSEFWPYGSYLFCSEDGSFCIDDPTSVVRMMHLMLKTGSANTCIEDNLMYVDYISHISSQVFRYRSFSGNAIPESSYDAGVALALDSTGVSHQVGQLLKKTFEKSSLFAIVLLNNGEPVAGQVKECIERARKIERAPVLRCAQLANQLAKFNPFRLEIQWYKELCDRSPEQMGYYDAFKRRASKREFRVDMNRVKLGLFWENQVIKMLEENELPHDFHLRKKWVCGAQFYKLLVEPLDIADYYRNRKTEDRGRHYLSHGRERRYEIFDRWWRDRNFEAKEYRRSRYASLTQDSCFWARVEEAKENLSDLRTETDPNTAAVLWGKIVAFEAYARRLVQRMEVSEDVLAENSSYSVWVRELERYRSQNNIRNGEWISPGAAA